MPQQEGRIDMKFNNIASDIATARTRLGPDARKTLSSLIDLGLNDLDIGRYHQMSTQTVAALRMSYGLSQAHSNTMLQDDTALGMIDDRYLVDIQRCNGDITGLY
ncbi:hypothetical protein C1J05_06455 [Sulfitobacter sp. JL08]|nr:hypothetical protein C1J05_06455 [Sulfitobacter sp. JL08]